MDSRGKIKTGIVVSNKMDKTIVVRVDSVKTHPLYKKQYTVSTNFKVHDGNNEHNLGDAVTIIETKPYSKDKSFKVKK